jgi:VWFA-related protein
MRIFLHIWVLLAFSTGIYAQSGRVRTNSDEKANTKVTPAPTPIPSLSKASPLDADDQPAEGDVIKVETDLVTIPVRIIDRNGRFAGGLRKENFKIFEDGIEQDVAYFSNEQQPFTVALILDMSYSSTFKISEIQRAATTFIGQLQPEDKVLVASFDEDVHILCEPTNDRQAIFRAIKSTTIQTGTSLYEAVDRVVNDRLKMISGRKAIILFTDGVDTTSTRSNDLQNISDIRELDAIVYPIRYDTFADVQDMKGKGVVFKPGTSGNPLPVPTVGVSDSRGTTVEEYKRAREYLDQMALRSGGRVYEANTSGNLSSAFSRIASELREYYSLGFYPKKDGRPGRIRKLKVRVDRAGVAINARDSYVVPVKNKKRF